MLVVALQAQSHSQSYTLAAQVSERIIVRVTAVSLVVLQSLPVSVCLCAILSKGVILLCHPLVFICVVSHVHF